MPVISKYSNKQVEELIAQLITTLEKNGASPELSLMCLGNAASIIINENYPEESKAQIAQSFAAALTDSTKN